MRVLVAGGCGYIGAQLTPWLLAAGHQVTVYDTMFFGDGHPADNGNLTITRGDTNDAVGFVKACIGQEAVIHLASISNDAMAYRNRPRVLANNLAGFAQNVATAKAAGVKRFVYASSVAAYGSSPKDATEETPLRPETTYGRTKAACEAILKSYEEEGFACTVVRSASVCGPSMNMRFDITANKLIRDAILTGTMKVNGGDQKRCHVHIHDLCQFYVMLLDRPVERVGGQAYNVVSENMTVMDTAMLVARTVKEKPTVHIGPSTDHRSYTVSGEKAKHIGFVPLKRIETAILDIQARFDIGQWKDALTNEHYMRML